MTAGLVFLAGCGEPSGPTTSGDTLTQDATVSQRTKRIKKIFRAAPTPMETARIVQKTGAAFNTDNLHSAMSAGNYVTSDKQAINLGVYGADLSYATIFEENAISLTYLEVVKSLARELGVGDVIGEDMLARAEANRARQDSLVSIVSEAFFNLNEKLTRFSEHWSPRVIAEMNDYQFKLAKLQGEFVWHHHADTDEVFLVLEGELIIELRDGEVRLGGGEMYVVPKGVEHRPRAEHECHVLLVEPRGVVNTGDAGGELTAANDVWV